MEMLALDRHSIVGLAHEYSSVAGQQIRHHAFMRREVQRLHT
jgi:hypothetical protein